MNPDFGAASSTLVMTLMVLAVVLAVFLILRVIVLWYFRVDHIADQLSHLNGKQLQANELLQEIADHLAARKQPEAPPVSPQPAPPPEPQEVVQRAEPRNPLTGR